MRNNLTFIIVLGIVIGLATEYLAPILDKRFQISSFISNQIEINDNVDRSGTSSGKNYSEKYSDFKIVKSSSGHKLKIPNTCYIEYQKNSEKLIDNELKNKNIILSDGTKLNQYELNEERMLQTDVISCENIDAIWNIIKQRYDYNESIDSSNIMNTCINFGEIINHLYDGRAKIYKCELEEGTPGVNNVYTEFEGFDIKSNPSDKGLDKDGKFRRFVHNFYFDRISFNIFGQCPLNGPECSSVKDITKMISYSYDQVDE